MSKDTTAIFKLINNAPIGSITSIDLVGNGYASTAYKVTSSEGIFIALTQKEDSIAAPDYAYYFAILKTLETINYEFAPRAVYLNPKQSIILMTTVPGEAISWINTASEDQQKKTVEILVKALLGLRAAPFSHCAKTYKQLSGKQLETTTIEKNIQHYMTDWFELAQTGQPDPTLTKWIKPKVAACEVFARHMKPSNRTVLVHGDTSEGNIFLSRDLRLHLIDWDGSSFDQFPDGWDDFGMAYLMNHVPLFQKFRPLVISLVSERCHVPTHELEAIIIRLQELIKLGDIQWAYMMHARASAGEIKSKPKEFFLSVARERINDYEKTFSANSFLS
jgi:aminoglycoside phosphotransferase (APT) family kinase protein